MRGEYVKGSELTMLVLLAYKVGTICRNTFKTMLFGLFRQFWLFGLFDYLGLFGYLGSGASSCPIAPGSNF